jgi:hypothetical protein
MVRVHKKKVVVLASFAGKAAGLSFSEHSTFIKNIANSGKTLVHRAAVK